MPGQVTVDLFPLTAEEVEFLKQLHDRAGRFLVIGMSAAAMQGADVGTKDIDLWFEHQFDEGLAESARSVGGIFIWRADPPTLGGRMLSRIDLVNHCHGLSDFGSEYDNAVDVDLEGIPLKLLPINRIIDSKKAANRPKDRAALPALRAALKALKFIGER